MNVSPMFNAVRDPPAITDMMTEGTISALMDLEEDWRLFLSSTVRVKVYSAFTCKLYGLSLKE